MLLLETAKILKDAGLEWNPVSTDMYYRLFKFNSRTAKGLYLAHDMDMLPDDIFAPRLEQLLAEIDSREYWWELGHHTSMGSNKIYYTEITKKYNTSIPEVSFYADSPEEAAALALLTILEQEVKPNEL